MTLYSLFLAILLAARASEAAQNSPSPLPTVAQDSPTPLPESDAGAARDDAPGNRAQTGPRRRRRRLPGRRRRLAIRRARRRRLPGRRAIIGGGADGRVGSLKPNLMT